MKIIWYTIDQLGIKCSYYKRKSKTEKEQPPKMTYQDVFRAYEELLLKQYQDAIILNFIYTYAIDPYVINTLTYEEIFEEGILKFWDYKSYTILTKVISRDLINDLNFF